MTTPAVDAVARVGRRLRSRAGLPDDVGLEEAALGSAAERTPWKAGTRGAVIAVLASLPWIVLAVHDQAASADRLDAYALARLTARLPLAASRWALYGFFFGYLFLHIPGRTGLTKSLRLFVTLAIPALVLVLAPGPPTRDAIRASGVTVAELFVLTAVLGLAADYFVLRRHGFGVRELRNVYSVYPQRLLLTWVSSLVLAIGGALTTLLVHGFTSAFLFFVPLPPTPAQPLPGTLPAGPQR